MDPDQSALFAGPRHLALVNAELEGRHLCLSRPTGILTVDGLLLGKRKASHPAKAG